MASNFQSVPVNVGDGGALMADRPIGAIGMANYTQKLNWRRSGTGPTAEEVSREGWNYFFPNSGGSDVNQRTIAAGTVILAIGEARRPNGTAVPVSISSNGKIYFFDYDAAQWTQIGTGYSSPPAGRRWQIVGVGPYVVFNNGIDLPATWKVGDASVTPIYELREQGVASVGTIWEYQQILMVGDVLEILPASMSAIMNGGTPYGQVIDPTKTQRIQYRSEWSNLGDPRDFGATVLGSATSGSPTVTLAWPMASLAIGNEITIIGAGPAGGNLVTTISNLVGTALTLAVNASTTIASTPVQKTTALNSIVGFYDFEDDGAAVLRGLPLQNRLVVYKANSIFVGYYTGDIEEPFSFERQYSGARTPRFRWTLINVGSTFHLYAGDKHFYRFRLGVQQPEIDQPLEDCKTTLFFSKVTTVSEDAVWASDNACTNEIFIWAGGGTNMIAYDYAFGTVSSVDGVSYDGISPTFTCGASIHKPLTGKTVDERELIFLMGGYNGLATQYGRTNLALLTTSRYGLVFTCQWITGLSDFGDPFDQKDVRTWVVLNSVSGSTSSATFVLLGTDRDNLAPTQLESKAVEAGGATPTIVPLYYRKAYFQEQFYTAPVDEVRIRGRVWEVGKVRTRAIDRIS